MHKLSPIELFPQVSFVGTAHELFHAKFTNQTNIFALKRTLAQNFQPLADKLAKHFIPNQELTYKEITFASISQVLFGIAPNEKQAINQILEDIHLPVFRNARLYITRHTEDFIYMQNKATKESVCVCFYTGAPSECIENNDAKPSNRFDNRYNKQNNAPVYELNNGDIYRYSCNNNGTVPFIHKAPSYSVNLGQNRLILISDK